MEVRAYGTAASHVNVNGNHNIPLFGSFSSGWVLLVYLFASALFVYCSI